jgi:hypothetical protein
LARQVKVSQPRSSEVEIVRDMTATFRRLDNLHGGGHSRATTTITSYLTSTVTPMLKDTARTPAARDELYAAAAELHQVASWIACDVGNGTCVCPEAVAGRRQRRARGRDARRHKPPLRVRRDGRPPGPQGSP